MSILEFLTGPDEVAGTAKVAISSSGQMSVDFADVMKTSQYQRDLDAIREIAASVAAKA
jgi:hypothetical protein